MVCKIVEDSVLCSRYCFFYLGLDVPLFFEYKECATKIPHFEEFREVPGTNAQGLRVNGRRWANGLKSMWSLQNYFLV